MTKIELRNHLITIVAKAVLRGPDPRQIDDHTATALVDRMIASDMDPAWGTVLDGRDVLQHVINIYRSL